MATFPNVFIGTPTHACKRYCVKQFVDAVRRYAPGAKFVMLCNSRGAAGFDLFFDGTTYLSPGFSEALDDSYFDGADSIHKRITRTCNELRERFLLSDCDLYLSLESDVILGPDTLPRMVAAISDEYPIVYANCYRWPGGRGFLDDTRAGPVDRVTMGCTLMRRKVLEAIGYRYDPNLLGAFPDAHFALDCRNKGFKMWYDPTIWCDHLETPAAKGVGSNRRGWAELPESEKWWRQKS